MSTRGWRPARMLMLTVLAAASALPGAATAAAEPPVCPPRSADAAWLTADLPPEVVFGRALTVTAGVRAGVTDARLELRTAAGTLLAESTAVTAGAMRIADLPTPRGGTTALTARVTALVPDGAGGCRVTVARSIRLVPGRLGRLRVDDRGGVELTIRTAAGEGCQDYLRASTVLVSLTDVTDGRGATEVLESVHPCDGWTVRRGSRSRRIDIEPRDANLVLCAPHRPASGRFRLTITRSGAVVARGTVVVAGARVGYVPDRRGGR